MSVLTRMPDPGGVGPTIQDFGSRFKRRTNPDGGRAHNAHGTMASLGVD